MISTKPTLHSDPTAIKLTYEEYRKTPDDKRYELLDGELIMAPAPLTGHQLVQVALGAPLYTFVKQRGLGLVFFAPTDVVLSDTNVVQPALLFVSTAREHIVTRANIQGAPDLVVEIRSDSTAERDWTLKRELYAEHGVKEYWLVDPEAMTVTVLLLHGDVFNVVGIYWKGQRLTSPTLEGFTVSLDEIFRVYS